jgi:hypothetical protein
VPGTRATVVPIVSVDTSAPNSEAASAKTRAASFS